MTGGNALQIMPAEFLWLGDARAAYVEMCAASGYTRLRNNGASSLVTELRAEHVLALGVGPHPSTELDILQHLAAVPAIVTAHDITVETASEMALAVRAAGHCSNAYPGDLPGALRFPDADLTLMMGYTIGNFNDRDALAILHSARRAGRHMLVDAPCAAAGDPRRAGATYDATAEPEGRWLRAAYRAWRGTLPRHIRSVVTGDDREYVINIVADDEDVLLSFHRRTVAGWLALYEFAGWQPLDVRILPGIVPRLIALLH